MTLFDEPIDEDDETDDVPAARPSAASRLPRGRPVPLPLMPNSPRYSIADLEAETGFPRRTIRYYVDEGLLMPSHGRGPSATYDKDHLLRLKMIVELKGEFLPLGEIKRRLARYSTEDLESHFAIATAPTEEKWRRIAFGPDLELHVRDKGERNFRFERLVDQLTTNIRFLVDNHEETK